MARVQMGAGERGPPKLYLEKRAADGSLDFTSPQPPFAYCTERGLAEHYFRHCGHDRPTATQEEIRAWYAAQGFVWRPVTWPLEFGWH